MKKVFLTGAIALSLLGLSAFSLSKNNPNIETENYDCQYGQCLKIKKDGNRCKNCAQESSDYCWSHNR
jgi:hypothetical protein